MAQPEATGNKNISKNNVKNIWRINKNNLPLHPQSRGMRQRHGGRDAWRGEAEVGKSKRKRRTRESGRKKLPEKIWKIKEKSLPLHPQLDRVRK